MSAAAAPNRSTWSKMAAVRSQSWPASPFRQRELDRSGHEHRLHRDGPGGGGHRGQHGAGAIRAAAVQEVVVHLHHDPAPGGELDPGSRPEAACAEPRRPGGDPPGVVEDPARAPARPASDTGTAEAGPSRAPGATVECCSPGDGGLRDPVEDHVMDDGGVAGDDPRRGDEGVPRQLRVEEEAAVIVGRALRRGRAVGRRHRQLEPRLATTWRRRRRGRRPDRRATPCGSRPDELRARPVDERRALPGVERVGRLAHILRGGGGGRPRRHAAPLERRDDEGRAVREVALRPERERRDAAVPVAAEARLADDRSDVAREIGSRGRRGRCRPAAPERKHEKRDDESRREPSRHHPAACHAAHRTASYVPHRPRSAPQSSPTVARAASARRSAGSRFSSVSATRDDLGHRLLDRGGVPLRAEGLEPRVLRALDRGVEAVQLDEVGLVRREAVDARRSRARHSRPRAASGTPTPRSAPGPTRPRSRRPRRRARRPAR